MRRVFLLTITAVVLACGSGIHVRADNPVPSAPPTRADRFAAYPHSDVWWAPLPVDPGETVSAVLVYRDFNQNLIIRYGTTDGLSEDRWNNRYYNFFARKLVATVRFPGAKGIPRQSREFRFDPARPALGLNSVDETYHIRSDYSTGVASSTLHDAGDFLADGSRLTWIRVPSSRDTHALPFRGSVIRTPRVGNTETFALIWVSKTRRKYWDPDYVPWWELRRPERDPEDRWDAASAGWYGGSYIHSQALHTYLTALGDGTYLMTPVDSEQKYGDVVIRVTSDLDSPFFAESDEYLRIDLITLVEIEHEARAEALRIRAESLRSGRALNTMNLFEIADEYATRRFRELIAANHRSSIR